MESKTLPATVSQQSYTDMISAIRAVGSNSLLNVVATLNRTISKFTREFAQAEVNAKMIASMGHLGSITRTKFSGNACEEARAAKKLIKPVLKDTTNVYVKNNGQYQRYGQKKRARFQRDHDYPEQRHDGQKTITKHVAGPFHQDKGNESHSAIVELPKRIIHGNSAKSRDQNMESYDDRSDSSSGDVLGEDNPTNSEVMTDTITADKQAVAPMFGKGWKAMAQVPTATADKTETSTATTQKGTPSDDDLSKDPANFTVPNEDIADHVAANIAAAKAHMAFLVARYERKGQAKAYVSGQSSSHEEDDSESSTSQDDKARLHISGGAAG
jgi:hypothetical protein